MDTHLASNAQIPIYTPSSSALEGSMLNNQLKAIFASPIKAPCASLQMIFLDFQLLLAQLNPFTSGKGYLYRMSTCYFGVHTPAILARFSGASWLKHYNECWISFSKRFQSWERALKVNKRALLNPPRLICSKEREETLGRLDDPEAAPNGTVNMSWIGRHVKLSLVQLP